MLYNICICIYKFDTFKTTLWPFYQIMLIVTLLCNWVYILLTTPDFSLVYDTYFLYNITISFLFRDDKFPYLGQMIVDFEHPICHMSEEFQPRWKVLL